MTEIEVRGERFVLTPEKALYWPSQRLLAIADLHLGKSETFQQHGMWLPSNAHIEDLQRIEHLASDLGAAHVVFLGDLVHTARGLTEELQAAFSEWMSRFAGEVTVAIGNHDVRLAKSWPASWSRAKMADRWQSGDFVFQHEPPSEAERRRGSFFWTGHVHPMIRLEQGPDHLRLPCYLISECEGLLPAFSSVAGGFNVTRKKSNHIYAVGAGRVFPI